MERPVCPKCGYARQATDATTGNACPRCGVVFAKYAQYLIERQSGQLPTQQQASSTEAEDEGWRQLLLARLFHLPAQAQLPVLMGEALLTLVLVVWGMWFIAGDWRNGDAGNSLLHGANLAFHEFGHLLFRPLGEWMMFLGGSLFQCLVPVILGGAFLLREGKPYAAAACLWWLGQNFIDLAPYIGDARTMDLPLIGEWNEEMVEFRSERHDWHNLLEPLGLLEWDHGLAALAHWSGALLMLAAWAWMGWWLWQCAQLLRESR